MSVPMTGNMGIIGASGSALLAVGGVWVGTKALGWTGDFLGITTKAAYSKAISANLTALEGCELIGRGKLAEKVAGPELAMLKGVNITLQKNLEYKRDKTVAAEGVFSR